MLNLSVLLFFLSGLACALTESPHFPERLPFCISLLERASAETSPIDSDSLSKVADDWNRKDLTFEIRQQLNRHFEFGRKAKGWLLNTPQTETLLNYISDTIPAFSKDLKERGELGLCFLISNAVIAYLLWVSKIQPDQILSLANFAMGGLIQLRFSQVLAKLVFERHDRNRFVTNIDKNFFSLFSGEGRLPENQISGLEFFPKGSKIQFDFIVEREKEALSSIILISHLEL